MKTSRVYRIVNRHGEKVTERATMTECVGILTRNVSSPPKLIGWSEGPYVILRVETTHIRTFRPRPSSPAPRKEPKEKST